MTLPRSVKIVEVGPRDGLQNETKILSSAIKIAFINQLAETGLQHIEATSFVSAHWVPQMADSEAVLQGIHRQPQVIYSALVPNIQGMEKALAANIQEIDIFTAVSETFCHKNINCSIEESLRRYEPVIALAQQHKIPVRGYISCVLGCPYEGITDPLKTAQLAERLINMGCYEISLGDTIGVGTPLKVQQLIALCTNSAPVEKFAVHFHDTYGQALVNIYAALQQGVQVIDSSVAGLGGCPYAKGASGNVATEDVIYLLDGLGIQSGVDLNKLIQAGNFICHELGHETRSKVSYAKTV